MRYSKTPTPNRPARQAVRNPADEIRRRKSRPSAPMENTTMRALIAALALCLVSAPAFAASPKIEAAIKTFKGVAANPAKLKLFCDMSKVMEKMGDKEDKALEAQIDGFLEKLGADFKAAWEAGDSVDEKSADGKALTAAIDGVAEKCPQ
jgi:hypothetical protein